jgi:hypothetical protein
MFTFLYSIFERDLEISSKEHKWKKIVAKYTKYYNIKK